MAALLSVSISRHTGLSACLLIMLCKPIGICICTVCAFARVRMCMYVNMYVYMYVYVYVCNGLYKIPV